MRWSVAAADVHVVVEPLDDEARAEVVWPVAPSTLCGRRGGSLPCEQCLMALAGLLAYGQVVHRWRAEGRRVLVKPR